MNQHRTAYKVIAVSLADILQAAASSNESASAPGGAVDGAADERRRARVVEAVVESLRVRDSDIVGLSEIWDLDLALRIRRALASVYPNSSLTYFGAIDHIEEVLVDMTGSERFGQWTKSALQTGAKLVGVLPGRQPSLRAASEQSLRSGLMLLAKQPFAFAERPRFFPVAACSTACAGPYRRRTPGVMVGRVAHDSQSIGLVFTHAAHRWSGRGEAADNLCTNHWPARDRLLQSLADAHQSAFPADRVEILQALAPVAPAKTAATTAWKMVTLWPTSLAELVRQARAEVHAVADAPRGRYRLREEWYRKWGKGLLDGPGYGRSELDFLEWEIERGVLHPVDHPRTPGSRWWRGVQGRYAFFAQLAGKVHDAGLSRDQLPLELTAWLDYFERPTRESWYRAHNINIIHAYIDRSGIGRYESFPEQLLINKILYRVIFAQALLHGQIFGGFGEFAADPRYLSVEAVLAIDSMYPRNYPLTHEDARSLACGDGDGWDAELTRLLDDGLILPRLTDLYAWAADHNGQPELRRLVYRGVPVYPHHDWYRRLSGEHRLAVPGHHAI